jgi:hypothetical protein
MDLFFDVHRLGMQLLFEAVEPARDAPGDAVQVLAAMMNAHALALFAHHAFESVVVQGVHLHRFGATTPAQRAVLDELIASRDRFEQLFRQQVVAGQQQGLVAEVNPSIAVKTLLGGLQWSLVWYRPERGDSLAQREQLARAMVQTLVEGLRARVEGPSTSAPVKRARRAA